MMASLRWPWPQGWACSLAFPEVGEVTASIEWENYDSLTAAWLQRHLLVRCCRCCLWLHLVTVFAPFQTMTVLDDTPLNNAEFGRLWARPGCLCCRMLPTSVFVCVCQVLLRESQLHRIWPARDSGHLGSLALEHESPLRLGSQV